MRRPASTFKHPIHPMLIVFPIGLWIFSSALATAKRIKSQAKEHGPLWRFPA